jgi:hypothetical protein
MYQQKNGIEERFISHALTDAVSEISQKLLSKIQHGAVSNNERPLLYDEIFSFKFVKNALERARQNEADNIQQALLIIASLGQFTHQTENGLDPHASATETTNIMSHVEFLPDQFLPIRREEVSHAILWASGIGKPFESEDGLFIADSLAVANHDAHIGHVVFRAA